MEPTQGIQTEATPTQVTSPEVDSATGKMIYKYQPTDTDGTPIGREKRYLYSDHNDLVSQLTKANSNADKFIHEVKTGKRKIEGDPAVARPEFKAREMSKDEQVSTTMGLQNPEKSRDSIRQYLEAELGAPLDVVRGTLQNASGMAIRQLAQEWSLENEANGYYIHPENAQSMVTFLEQNKLDYTRKNFDLAFEELKDSLVQRPSDNSQVTVQTPVQQTPSAETPSQTRNTNRTVSTGIIPGQSGARPRPTNQTTLSSERFRSIDKMSLNNFKQLQRDNPKEAELFLKLKHGS